MNQKLRNLVQQLGEAIHESVSESEQIAGVVKDIRKQGFDVLLMLEATIGLNELEQQPVGLDPTSASARECGSVDSRSGGETFTAQDLNFLKSLRIAVEERGRRTELSRRSSLCLDALISRIVLVSARLCECAAQGLRRFDFEAKRREGAN